MYMRKIIYWVRRESVLNLEKVVGKKIVVDATGKYGRI